VDGLLIERSLSVQLDEIVQAFGQKRYFNDRLDRQHRDRGVLLVAWLNGKPIGNVYLWLERAFEEEVVTRLPGVPLLSHLEVLFEYRKRGVGTALVQKSEEGLIARGFERVALSVGRENKDARRLYHDLGYTEWEYGPVNTITEVFGSCGKSKRVPDRDMSLILLRDLRFRHADGGSTRSHPREIVFPVPPGAPG
jgi:GNAT superfamily N-acetyltransferase